MVINGKGEENGKERSGEHESTEGKTMMEPIQKNTLQMFVDWRRAHDRRTSKI